MMIKEDLYYTEDHEWIRVEDDRIYIGITDYAQHSMGDIVYIELPDVDSEIYSGSALATIESVKAAADVYMPATGKVIQVNEELEDDPSLINTDPYENWIVCIEIYEEIRLESLMSMEEYEEFCLEEE